MPIAHWECLNRRMTWLTARLAERPSERDEARLLAGARAWPVKCPLTMRAALAFGLPAVARNIGRARRWSNGLLDRAGHEAGRGNVVTATALVALYLVGL